MAWCGRGVGVVQDTGGVDVRAAVVMGGVDTQVVTFTRDEVTVRDAHTLNPITTMDQGSALACAIELQHTNKNAVDCNVKQRYTLYYPTLIPIQYSK